MNQQPASPGTHALRITGLVVAVLLMVTGVWLFLGDLLVLLHRRPQFGDGPFGVMVGPILAFLGGLMFWQNLAAYGLVKAISIKPR